MTGVLIAGIGNIFFGDDGFGVEVIRRLDGRRLPEGARAVDYGIRGVHLAYDLLDGCYGALIMVDCLPTGEQPGTVSVLEVDDEALAEIRGAESTIDSHTMRPEAVLAALHALGGHIDRVLIIGCQPLSLAPRIGLSDPVSHAVDDAVELAITLSITEAQADQV